MKFVYLVGLVLSWTVCFQRIFAGMVSGSGSLIIVLVSSFTGMIFLLLYVNVKETGR